MNEAASLQSIEERINQLQDIVFSQPSKLKPLDVMEKTSNKLKEVENRHAVVVQLWNKLPQMNKFLDSDFMQKIKLDEQVKTNLILTNEQNLRQLSVHLDELNKLKDCVNTVSFKDVPVYSDKLQPLIQAHLDDKDELENVSTRLNRLLDTYNNIISTLSKQFVIWNTIITRCEQAIDSQRDAIE